MPASMGGVGGVCGGLGREASKTGAACVTDGASVDGAVSTIAGELVEAEGVTAESARGGIGRSASAAVIGGSSSSALQ
jgi:hypothetical protein